MSVTPGSAVVTGEERGRDVAIVVVTDSTAYLPQAVIDSYRIKVVPLNVTLGMEVFKEGTVYSNREYYRRLRSEKIFPTTSQPSTGDFYEAFSQTDPGDTILGIFITSKLSGTAHTAEMVKGIFPDRRIFVVDSRCTVLAMAFQVLRACEMAQAGFAIEDILDELKRIQSRFGIYFIVDDLEYLFRGGRLSRVGKLVGNILQIKPILFISLDTQGAIQVYDKVRTKVRALERIVEDFRRRLEKGLIERVGVCHVDCPEDAAHLQARIEALWGAPVPVYEVGPVIGSHVGPGAMGICYY